MARELQSLGFDAAALVGGYKAWKAGYPVEPKGKPRRSEPAEADGGRAVVGSGAGGK